MRFILVALFALAATIEPTTTRATVESPQKTFEAVVNCYDEGRQLVVRELASGCRGRVLSQQEADGIKNLRIERHGREIKNDGQPAPPGTSAMRRIGTAFFVDTNGKLITNYHVVAGCKALVVEPAGGDQTGPAAIEAIDAANDLALLDTQLPAPEVAAFERPGPLERGAFVAAVGYPDQGLPPRVPLLTRGVLESFPAIGVSRSGAVVLRAEVRPGESGGPIVNAYGLVIGMIRAKLNIPLIYSKTGHLPEDDGFGIPTATVLTFLERNGVSIRIAPRGSEELDPDAILSEASRYVVRVDCWE